MKRPVSIVLALLISLNSCGLFIFYFGEIQLCKIAAKHLAHSYRSASINKLRTFSSEEIDVEFAENSEIIVHGEFFDILKTEIKNGKVIYYVVNDDDENRCFQNILQLTKDNSSEKSFPGKLNAPNVLKYTYNQKLPLQFYPEFLLHDGLQKSSSDLFFYQSPYSSIFSPPPNNLI